jgi:aminopeptidase N
LNHAFGSRRTARSVLTALLFAATAFAAGAGGAAVEYDITVRIDPVARSIEGRSVITATVSGEFTLVLGRRFEVMRATVDGKPLAPPRAGAMQAWRVAGGGSAPRRIEYEWRGMLAALDASLDHRQVLVAAEPASGAEGTFLPDSSGWYPRVSGALARYRVTIELPQGQRGLVAGRLAEESESEGRYRARFEFLHPADGIDLMAGPYRVEAKTMHGAGGRPIALRTYFHPQVAELAGAYLESVAGYIALYESWIGDYPFTEFSVVSSPTPTGFGMPTLTYLGVEVLRLPFIRAISLGHEVLHNWWGNGVYPDYARGNWSEGLTTFMADYAYRERDGADAAREMRLSWLRDFAALAPAQDAALARFTSRRHGAEQIVGYHKAAMVFLMLRDVIGREAFDRGIREFWREQRFRVASWAELRRAFEGASGRDLTAFFEQWVQRPGAPSVRIAAAASARTAAGHRVTVTLAQSAPEYWLRVPVAVRTEKGEELHVLDLERARRTFTLEVQARPLEVALDPELRVFRRLAPDEAPPILRQAMVDPNTVTVLLPGSPDARDAAAALAARLQEHAPKTMPPAESLPAAPAVVIGLEGEVDAWLARHRLPARPEAVRGRGSAQAWTATRPDGGTLAVVSARDAASLAALARPLPHYGRQSYVIFEGAKAIERGTWPVRVQAVKLDRKGRAARRRGQGTIRRATRVFGGSAASGARGLPAPPARRHRDAPAHGDRGVGDQRAEHGEEDRADDERRAEVVDPRHELHEPADVLDQALGKRIVPRAVSEQDPADQVGGVVHRAEREGRVDERGEARHRNVRAQHHRDQRRERDLAHRYDEGEEDADRRAGGHRAPAHAPELRVGKPGLKPAEYAITGERLWRRRHEAREVALHAVFSLPACTTLPSIRSLLMGPITLYRVFRSSRRSPPSIGRGCRHPCCARMIPELFSFALVPTVIAVPKAGSRLPPHPRAVRPIPGHETRGRPSATSVAPAAPAPDACSVCN